MLAILRKVSFGRVEFGGEANSKLLQNDIFIYCGLKSQLFWGTTFEMVGQLYFFIH